MVRYLVSRFILVFFIKFCYSWIVNVKYQLIQFFYFSRGFWLDLTSYILIVIFIIFSVFVINAFFSIYHLSKTLSIEQIFLKIKKQGLLKSFKLYLNIFFDELKLNFEREVSSEKYPVLFLIYFFVFQLYPKGNPILNNYYGIYKEYEIDKMGGRGNGYEEYTDYIEEPSYIIHKSKAKSLKKTMKSMAYDDEYDEDYFSVNKRGYLFLQAGLIDGYKSYKKEHTGLLFYFECLLFSIIEKFINTVMYFLIPFVIIVLIINYKK